MRSWVMSDGSPPVALAITGTPADIASMTLRGRASLSDGSTKTSADASSAPTSGR